MVTRFTLLDYCSEMTRFMDLGCYLSFDALHGQGFLFIIGALAVFGLLGIVDTLLARYVTVG
jgi:hypothetical protein